MSMFIKCIIYLCIKFYRDKRKCHMQKLNVQYSIFSFFELFHDIGDWDWKMLNLLLQNVNPQRHSKLINLENRVIQQIFTLIPWNDEISVLLFPVTDKKIDLVQRDEFQCFLHAHNHLHSVHFKLWVKLVHTKNIKILLQPNSEKILILEKMEIQHKKCLIKNCMHSHMSLCANQNLLSEQGKIKSETPQPKK